METEPNIHFIEIIIIVVETIDADVDSISSNVIRSIVRPTITIPIHMDQYGGRAGLNK